MRSENEKAPFLLDGRSWWDVLSLQVLILLRLNYCKKEVVGKFEVLLFVMVIDFESHKKLNLL
jgi:hypothetical protein